MSEFKKSIVGEPSNWLLVLGAVVTLLAIGAVLAVHWSSISKIDVSVAEISKEEAVVDREKAVVDRKKAGGGIKPVTVRAESPPPLVDTETASSPIHIAPTGDRLPVPLKEPGMGVDGVQAEEPPVYPWKQPCLEGNYAGAIKQAGEGDIVQMEQMAAVNELFGLGNGARQLKKSGIAIRMLSALRKRFPASPKSATAAHLIGEINLKMRDNPQAALRWFRTYLAEAPSGTLVQDAYGHLFGISLSLDLWSEAQMFAINYLAQFPEGSLAQKARQILERADPMDTPGN